ncbi:hypothetical protein TL16_g01891 [Triparma laevis f. inornata]|uniref:Leucine-rich repeat domain-containing protein n=1 Tax=Triparma laevis f. inornata TaxID=1714386 RepID=A0A9W6ZNS5_9STRA|nr:hypothetical protein TL16_g01891 [Triparma laevis f. inornata]
MNDRFVKYEKMDNKSVLVELLRLRLRCEVLLSSNNFLNTNDFRRLLVEFIPDDMLTTMRVGFKPWCAQVTGIIDAAVESGTMLVHGEEELKFMASKNWPDFGEVGDEEDRNTWFYALRKMMKLVTRVIFLLNITVVRKRRCWNAENLVVVVIPEGVESIGDDAFYGCSSLNIVSFPTTLKPIGKHSFQENTSLENVDLLNTNLQKLGDCAFAYCSELKSISIPDLLQTIGAVVFMGSSKLVPSNIDVSFETNLYTDKTYEVVAHLRSLQN